MQLREVQDKGNGMLEGWMKVEEPGQQGGEDGKANSNLSHQANSVNDNYNNDREWQL